MMTEEMIQKIKVQLISERQQYSEQIEKFYQEENFHWGNTGRIYRAEVQLKVLQGKLEIIERILAG